MSCVALYAGVMALGTHSMCAMLVNEVVHWASGACMVQASTQEECAFCLGYSCFTTRWST